MGEEQKPTILYSGIDEETPKVIAEIVGAADLIEIKNEEEFGNFLENPPEKVVPLVVCGGGIPEVDASEVAQSFRMMFASAKIFYVSRDKANFDKKTMIKNGFDEVFLLPFDSRFFKKRIRDLKGFVKGSSEIVFRPVKVVDLQPDDLIDFDVSVYLPSVGKHIKYVGNGEPVEKERVERLEKFQVTSMYVDSSDLQKFYQYTAAKLHELGKGSMGETEKLEKLEHSVRDLFSGIFNQAEDEGSIAEGKEMLENCKEIVDSYILADDGGKEWYQKLIETIGADGDVYNHHSRVSTFVSMFAMATQVGNVEDMAIAGLFHDLGLSDLPAELESKLYEDMSAEEKEAYHLHPGLSVKMLKQKKISVPAIVFTMIEQHHERIDGSGFPEGKVPPILKLESQLLGIADEFDYLTCMDQPSGRKALKPDEAIKKIQDGAKFDPELVAKIKKLFPEGASLNPAEQAKKPA